MILSALLKSPAILIVIATALGLLASVVFYPIIRSKVMALLTLKRRKLFKYDMTVQNLLNHPVLAYLNLQQSGIKYLEYDDSNHTKTVQDMLNVLFATYKKAIKDFITEGVVLADKFAFIKLVDDTILQMDKLCETEWRKLDIENIEEVIMSFHLYQSQAAGFLQRAISNTTTSSIYDNNIERVQEILSLLQNMFDITIPDIDESFGLPLNKITQQPELT